MICSNCLEDRPEAHVLIPEKKYSVCDKCSVGYAKNRYGIAFVVDEDVMIKNYHSKVENRLFTIKGIFVLEECESGRMIYLVDKETQRPLKSVLDTNYLIKQN